MYKMQKTTNKNQMANMNQKSIGIKRQKTKLKTIAKKGGETIGIRGSYSSNFFAVIGALL
jgi:hypothetical protein